MDKKPNVLPTAEQMANANETGNMISEQLQNENIVQTNRGSDLESQVAAQMKKNTDDSLKMREENITKYEELARQMDAKRAAQLNEKQPYDWGDQPEQPPQESPINNNHDYYGGSGSNNGGNNTPPEQPAQPAPQPKEVNHYIERISQPQMNQPFDVIPLPSEGKLYPGIKKSVKVAFLTTADENILTSPNLVESGDFLEILINRKLLEPGLRYRDLIPGDRNAIMIWLRATGYGEMYPVTFYTKDNKQFDTEVNLSELKTVNLNVQPNAQGLFEFVLPLSKHVINFKLLTVGEIDDLEEILESKKDELINEEQTMILENQIVSVNGNKDKNFIKDFVISMRILDAQKLREYVNSIECGVDMMVEVRSPGGETIKTFLPLTPKFFWPNSQL